MKIAYQKAKTQFQTLGEFDHELPWLLALDLTVIAAGLAYFIGVLA